MNWPNKDFFNAEYVIQLLSGRLQKWDYSNLDVSFHRINFFPAHFFIVRKNHIDVKLNIQGFANAKHYYKNN